MLAAQLLSYWQGMMQMRKEKSTRLVMPDWYEPPLVVYGDQIAAWKGGMTPLTQAYEGAPPKRAWS